MSRVASALLAGLLLLAVLPAAAAGADPTFHIEQIASGYDRPLYVTAGSNPNFLYVVLERGDIKVMTRTGVGKPWKKAGTFLDLRAKVGGPYYSRGLLGMAFHPNYANNGRFYVFYTRMASASDPIGDIVIAEYQRRTNKRARPGSARTVLVIEHPTTSHMGGWLGFGPDGYMYATIGDATLDEEGAPQDLDRLLGKVLRFNPRKSVGQAGFIPPDNPFASGPGDDLVWAYGLRNPWRASFDRANGDLWLSDPGDVDWEEVDRFAPGSSGAGKNLGWPGCEGNHYHPEPIEGPQPCAEPDVVAPLIEYGHTDGLCSVIGGYVYRGTRSPTLNGRYFFGDYCTGAIWSVANDAPAGTQPGVSLDTDLLITSFGEDALGEIYVTGLDGTVSRIAAD